MSPVTKGVPAGIRLGCTLIEGYFRSAALRSVPLPWWQLSDVLTPGGSREYPKAKAMGLAVWLDIEHLMK